ncbi:DUF3990 domain-containing protein [Selenomonas artemidis]|jgi:hypothetical protein|uniref:DUF3990 domain-containing protein n=1 Tax=Selenomonas artemidis TaxID=671224 RepID=UPI0023F3E038|nr:DUF3990 domain-containing protein [Selenomonas artemidis]
MQDYEKNLFHGSKMVVEHPLREKCRPENDFGQCFYSTEVLDLAKEWACQDGTAGVVSAYTINMAELSVINLNTDEYHTLNWLGTILQYRCPSRLDDESSVAREYLIQNFAVDTSAADIVIGYRADDSYFRYAADYLYGRIGLDKLSEAMYLGKLGEQVAIQSERAFERLEFQDFYEVEATYISRYQMRDKNARAAYRETIKGQIYMEKTLPIAQIIREGIKNDDPRLFKSIHHGRAGNVR